ncbi:MAG: hypothetical protein Ct9H300mP28_13300 [Pseudomonadota bacterium]|nr:MAG: hypothetical protein Ct9H300mP28_13300 [Pseudomonadota bacterium]
MLKKKSKIIWILTVTSLFVGVTLFLLAPASAHKKRHSAADMQAFDDAYMEVVKMGDALFHGGGPQEELGITIDQNRYGMCYVSSICFRCASSPIS